MAGPLTGIVGGQSLPPQSTQTQVSQNTQGIRQPEEQQRETRATQVQPQGAPTNETQNTESQNTDVTRQSEFSVANDSTSVVENDPSAQRGSLIDIAV